MFVLEGCTGCVPFSSSIFMKTISIKHISFCLFSSPCCSLPISPSPKVTTEGQRKDVWQLLCLPSFILHQCFYLMRLLYNFKHHNFPFFRSLVTSLCNRGDGERRRIPSRDTTWKLMLNYCHLTCYLPLSPAQVMRNPL